MVVQTKLNFTQTAQIKENKYQKKKMNNKSQKSAGILFDEKFPFNEQLPRNLSILFTEEKDGDKLSVHMHDGEKFIGDPLTDNTYESDFYRYHDVFHLVFAGLLGWSPCLRSMLKIKRKSVPIVDEVEDGARARITEEAISLTIFNYAKEKGYFKYFKKIDPTLLTWIKKMTENLEVKNRTEKEWENTILKSYAIFRKLIAYRGGKITINLLCRSVCFNKITIQN